MSTNDSPRRRVTVGLTARDKNDPTAQLEAVRHALSKKGISLCVREIKDDAREDEITVALNPTIVMKDEPLETKARELAAAVLDREQAKVESQAIESLLIVERKTAEIIAQRAGFQQFVLFQLARGIKISVDIYESISLATGAVIKKVLKFVGDDKRPDEK